MRSRGRGDALVGLLIGTGTVFVAVLIGRALTRRAEAATIATVPRGLEELPREPTRPPIPPPPSAPIRPSVHEWQPVVRELIKSEYPRVDEGFAMKWIEKESGGNPCSVGLPSQLAADGSNDEPREIGIGQLYNPDNFTRRNLSPKAFRAFCHAAAPLAEEYRRAVAAKDKGAAAAAARRMQTQTRPLTDQEKYDQVKWTVLDKIAEGMAAADKTIAQYGLPWTGRDYWKLVKVPHAYPPIVRQGLPAVVKKLARAPATWAEFRRELGMDRPDAEAKAAAGDPEAAVHWLWMRALNNVEAVGDAASAA